MQVRKRKHTLERFEDESLNGEGKLLHDSFLETFRIVCLLLPNSSSRQAVRKHSKFFRAIAHKKVELTHMLQNHKLYAAFYVFYTR